MTVNVLPAWAESLKLKYIRNEASVFILHGNVYDNILVNDKFLSLTDFLGSKFLQKTKDFIGVYNIANGFRKFEHALSLEMNNAAMQHLLSLPLASAKTDWLVALEKLMISNSWITSEKSIGDNSSSHLNKNNESQLKKVSVALILEYAESLVPAGDPSMQMDIDRAAVVAVHRWSVMPEITESDNLIILIAENLSEISEKLVSNPRIAVIEIPLPDQQSRSATISKSNSNLTIDETNRYTELTAGLKNIETCMILNPQSTGSESSDFNSFTLKKRTEIIARSLNFDDLTDKRAVMIAEQSLDKSEQELLKMFGTEQQTSEYFKNQKHSILKNIETLIFKRKREIIERECFGLLEFIEPKFDLDSVGCADQIKVDLKVIAANMISGHTNRVPMGVLLTGAQGTGKTFMATAFAGSANITTVKLKNFRSKWVGSSEGNLEKILSVIKAIGQVIVVIDEADRAFGNMDGDGGDEGTSSRIIAKLKEFMSDTSNRGRVLFVLMTNRPDKIDLDLKRAGRIDRKIPLFYPQNAEECLKIAAAICKKNELDISVEVLEKSDVWKKMVGYSAADIEAVLMTAQETASVYNDTLINESAGDDPVNLTNETPSYQKDTLIATAGVNPVPFEITDKILTDAFTDYYPTRDTNMINFMELQAVFECSNRKYLPEKYKNQTVDQIKTQIDDTLIKMHKFR